jgi:hypothetical protein
MALTNSHLREILTQIRPSQNQRDFFHSKWLRIINFLYNSTGYSISKVGKGGSQGKQTQTYQSDFDIIFSCSDNYDRLTRFNDLYQNLRAHFGVATNRIIQKTRAVYLEFPNDYSFDVVLLGSQEFNIEMRRLSNFRQSDDKMLNTIRLCKYACSQVKSCKIESYEIETKVEKLYKKNKDLADNTYRTLQSISSSEKIALNSMMNILT